MVFAFRDSRGGVDVAFTDRHGGRSAGPYSSLNLADSGGDDPGTVAENLRLVTEAFTSPSASPTPSPGRTTNRPGRPAGATPVLVRMRQVHGADVHVVDADHVRHPERRQQIVADALVTAEPGAVLMVRVADCVPVLLADVAHGVVGAAHAGRPGMVAGVIANTVAAMRDLGAEQITAWLGPHVCGRCYEVPEQMRAEVGAAVPEAYAETSWGTPAVDIGAGVRAQLEKAGASVVEASRCTIEHDELFSYRRQGKQSGRLAGLVWVRA